MNRGVLSRSFSAETASTSSVWPRRDAAATFVRLHKLQRLGGGARAKNSKIVQGVIQHFANGKGLILRTHLSQLLSIESYSQRESSLLLSMKWGWQTIKDLQNQSNLNTRQFLCVKCSSSRDEHLEHDSNSVATVDMCKGGTDSPSYSLQYSNIVDGAPYNKPKKFKNKYLGLVRLGSEINNAAESFFKSEIRRRLFITVVLVIASRVGYFIPLPGFDRRLIPEDYLGFVSGSVEELGDLSTELKLSVFQLGISPYIFASIIMQKRKSILMVRSKN